MNIPLSGRELKPTTPARRAGPVRQNRATTGREEDRPPSERLQNQNPKDAAACNSLWRQMKEGLWHYRKPLALVAAALLAVSINPWSSTESRYENWSHHQQATAHWLETKDLNPAERGPAKWISKMGPARFGPHVFVGLKDADDRTTEAVHDALIRQDWQAADAALRQGQVGLPDAEIALARLDKRPELKPVTPSLSPGMRAEILRGDARCFHIFLFDSCDQDGDIVDIIINGHRFATVPITNAGTTLSVPLSGTTPTTLSIRGVWDGGGGITVACRTSQGEGFVRIMAPGEEQPLGIAGQ